MTLATMFHAIRLPAALFATASVMSTSSACGDPLDEQAVVDSDGTEPPVDSGTPSPLSDEFVGQPNDELVGQTSQALTNCVPGNYEVAVFQHSHRQGSCFILGEGTYYQPSMTGLPNDSISSYIVGSRVFLKGTEHAFFEGTAFWDHTSRDTLSWWNDRISALQVYLRDTTSYPRGYATLWTDANFSGQPAAVSSLGTYYHIVLTGMKADVLSSFTINVPGMKLTLCTDTGLGGFCEVFTESQAYLGNLAIGNDTVISLKLEH